MAIPADDGAIQRAFAELDARMDAWLEGMNRAHEALVALAARAAAFGRSGSGEACEPASQVASDVAGDQADRPPVATQVAEVLPPTADPAPAEETAPPPAVCTDSRAGRVPAEPPTAAAGVEPAAAPQKSEPLARMETPVPAAPVGPAAEPVGRRAPASGNDEALLASVDPEVAKAIRVRRRLNPNGKSVAELLAEYQANPPAPKAEEPRKKSSWWKRG